MPADPLDDLPGEPEAKPAPAQTKVAAAAAPVGTPPDREPPTKHTHSRKLVEVATHFGISQEDLDEYPSADIWEEVHRLQMISAAQPKPVPSPPGSGTNPQGGGEGLPAEDEFEGLFADLDPRLAKLVKKQRDDLKAIREKDTERTTKLDALERAEQQRATTRIHEVVDAAFSALGKKYEPLVGTDSMAELTDPGEVGWRTAIYKKAKINHATDSPKTVARKIAEAAAILAKGKVEDDAEEPAAGYTPAAKRKPAQDPDTGRFTVQDYLDGQVAKPSGKKPGPDDRSAVEKTREMFRQNGDPRGFRPAVTMDDDDLAD